MMKKINNHFFGTDEVYGADYLFYLVIALGVFAVLSVLLLA